MKLHRVHAILIICLSTVLLASGCGGSGDESEVASIEDRVLTRSDLDDLLPSGDATVPSRVAEIVSSWLITQAMELEVTSLGEPITTDDIEQATEFVDQAGSDSRTDDRDTLIHAYALSFAIGRWAEAEAEGRPEPEPPEYLCSNHILLDTEAEAETALDRYSSGEEFAELAVELSTGPSGPDGGDLGCVISGQFVSEFEEAAFAAEAGDVIGPIETEFGFHLIEIESVGPATSEFHPDVEPSELEAVATQNPEELTGLVILELEEAAMANYRQSVTLDPSIGTLGDNDFTILPPT